MAIGVDIGDAYIDVHANSDPFRRELRQAARRSGTEFSKEFEGSVDPNLSPLAERLRRSMRKAGRISGEAFDDALLREIDSTVDRANRAFVRGFATLDFSEFVEHFQDVDNAAAEFAERMNLLRREGVLNQQEISEATDAFDDFALALRRSAGDRRVLSGFQAISASIREAAQDTNNLRRGLGRLRGGRNDFLNLVGAAAQLSNALGSGGVAGAVTAVATGVRRLGQGLLQVGGPLTNVGAALTGFGDRIQRIGSGGIDGVVVQIVALGLSMGALFAVLGPVAAGISTLGGSLIVLATTIGGGLLGAIATLGPMLLALGAGAGVAALAFTDMSDSTKEAFQPLGDLLGELRDVAQSALFEGIGGQVEALADSLSTNLTPVVQATAEALRDFFDSLVERLQGDEFSQLMEQFATVLPGLLTGLLDLVVNLSGALSGLFIAAAPAAQTFLDLLNSTVERFIAWMNTEEGQQAMSDFFADAVEITRQLWEIVEGVASVLGTLFTEGNEQGKNFLETLGNIVTDFAEWLNSKEGQDQLREWLNDVERIGGQVGDVIKELGELFDDLDSSGTRTAFSFILDGIRLIIRLFRGAASAVSTVADRMEGPLRSASSVLRTITDRLRNISSTARNLVNAAFNKIIGVLRNLKGVANNAWDGFIDASLSAVNFINSIIYAVQDLVGWISNIRFPSPPSWLFGGFGRFAEGGIVTGPTRALIGEAGPEAVIPLDRPLSMVDPSVRALSALLQGQGRQAELGPLNAGATQIQAGAIQVVTPYANPRLVALEVMNSLAQQGK